MTTDVRSSEVMLPARCFRLQAEPRLIAFSDDGRYRRKVRAEAPIVATQWRRSTIFPASLRSGFLAQAKIAGFPPSSALLRPEGACRSPVVVRTVIETAIKRGSKQTEIDHGNHRQLHQKERPLHRFLAHGLALPGGRFCAYRKFGQWPRFQGRLRKHRTRGGMEESPQGWRQLSLGQIG